MQKLSTLTKFKASKKTLKHNSVQGSVFTVFPLSAPVSVLLCVISRIIQRTIRAAVEQHFFELKTSIDQDLSSYDSQGWECKARRLTFTRMWKTQTWKPDTGGSGLGPRTPWSAPQLCVQSVSSLHLLLENAFHTFLGGRDWHQITLRKYSRQTERCAQQQPDGLVYQ